MTTNKQLLSIIIPTYNNAHIVPLVVASVFNQTLPETDFELIVIDDGSTDQTQSVLEIYQNRPDFRYVYQTNKGRSAARNRGITEARGELLLFLDSDKVLANDALEQHLASHEEFRKVSVIGKTLLPAEVLNANIYMQATHEGEVQPTRKRKLPFSYFVTGNLSVAKQWIEDAGGFDETFKVYGWEDSELGLRLEKMGIELICNHNLVCYHHHVHTLNSQIDAMRKMGQSAWIFTQKVPSWNLKLFLGIHPLNIGLFNFGKLFPSQLEKIMAKIEQKESEKNKSGLAFLYNLVKQYHYIKGYLEAKERAGV